MFTGLQMSRLLNIFYQQSYNILIVSDQKQYFKRTLYTAIGLMSKVFANGPGDHGSFPGRVIPKTQKMVLYAALLSTHH